MNICNVCNEILKECVACKQTVCVNCTINSELSLDLLLNTTYLSTLHKNCLECNDNITCRPTEVCDHCMNNLPTHTIYFISNDAYVSLGNKHSSYEPFDIIVNLDYPHNNVKMGEIKTNTLENGKTVISCGIEDESSHFLEQFMSVMFDRLLDTLYTELYKKAHLRPKVLFHCYAGISRSATAIILFLSDFLEISTKESYEIVKEKRKCILPNKLFQKILGLEL